MMSKQERKVVWTQPAYLFWACHFLLETRAGPPHTPNLPSASMGMLLSLVSATFSLPPGAL